MQALPTSSQTPLAVRTYTQPHGFRAAVPLVATDRPLMADTSRLQPTNPGQQQTSAVSWNISDAHPRGLTMKPLPPMLLKSSKA